MADRAPAGIGPDAGMIAGVPRRRHGSTQMIPRKPHPARKMSFGFGLAKRGRGTCGRLWVAWSALAMIAPAVLAQDRTIGLPPPSAVMGNIHRAPDGSLFVV